jgi:hypothetical protein
MSWHPAIWRSGGVPGWSLLGYAAARVVFWCATILVVVTAASRAAERAAEFANQVATISTAATSSPSSDALQAPPAKQAASQRPEVCKTFRVREQDQVWVVSTRHLGCPSGDKNDPPLQFWRYERGYWQHASAAEFYAADSADLVTPIFIHGNRIDHPEACREGLDVYFQLVGKLDDEPPARFVIWSWPSSQIHGPIRDARAKAARSDVDAYYLARFLARMQPEVRVGMVGFSLGARIIAGSLHLLGGGTLLGQTVEASQGPQSRVAFWAAAEHNDWLLPGHYHGEALPEAERWFNTVNCCDPVLAHYRLLVRCSNPVALGYAGMYGRNLLPADLDARIEEVNVSNIVGRRHSMYPYLYSLYIQNRTRDFALWHEMADGKLEQATALATAK